MKLIAKFALIFSAFLLLIITALLFYTSNGEWQHLHAPKIEDFVDNLQKQSPPQYEFGNASISLGDIKDPHNAYFHLKLRFRIDSLDGHPNLFQTATLNNGLRIEFGGSSVVIIVADTLLPDKYRAIYLSKALEFQLNI